MDNPEKTPKQWGFRIFANIGFSEEFVQQLMDEMPTLVDAGTIPEPRRQQVKDAIRAISFEGLMPAFEHLKRIRASVKESIPELNRKQPYSACVCRQEHLW